ncbi:hypothetical protein BOTBODRAFT_50630 [Botryobasidium botryosum FD-172 SS1]|uniref:Uncharacterized protein n=1 Tax=Botryobasidium botryosum (strain FD-172 SS1) TaxID=930990 RepID=A0A067N0R1_BOTB1|nr:hypothetical protein BOTBODRAFT_50630 [Botryobasidium botryosum FD-172 SS1]
MAVSHHQSSDSQSSVPSSYRSEYNARSARERYAQALAAHTFQQWKSARTDAERRAQNQQSMQRAHDSSRHGNGAFNHIPSHKARAMA